MRKNVSVLLLVIVLAALLAGCGGGGAAAATKTVCTGLTGLDTAMAAVGTLTADTAVSDILAQKAKLDPIIEPIRKAAATLKIAPLDQLVLAYDGLGKTISALPADAKLGDASTAVTDGMKSISGATGPLKTTLKCGN